jgi:dynein light intermediate chain
MEEALVEANAPSAVATRYDDPQQRTAELLAAAVEQQPKGFLQYDQPVALKPSLTVRNEDGSADVGKYLQSMAPFIPPYIQQQTIAISEKPIITTTDKILPAILPPRRFSVYDEATGHELEAVQAVSRRQALREDLAAMERMLDFKLSDSKARMMGLCPVRSAILEMVGDELLRQIAIDLPERGLLLRRVMNESRMTTDAWRSLNAEASLYCTRQLHDGAKGNPEILDRIAQLTSQVTTLRAAVKSLETKHSSLERSVAEQALADQKRYNEEKAFLDNTRKRLQQHLDNVKHMQEQERKAMMGLAEPVAAS